MRTSTFLDQSFTPQPENPKKEFPIESTHYTYKTLKEHWKEYEAFYIQEALNQFNGDITQTALSLEMPVSTLYLKIRTYGLKTK